MDGSVLKIELSRTERKKSLVSCGNSPPTLFRPMRIFATSEAVAWLRQLTTWRGIRLTYLPILDAGQALDEIWHVHQQTPQFLHVVGVALHDLLDGIGSSLECPAPSVNAKHATCNTHTTSRRGRPIHSRINRRPIRVRVLHVSESPSRSISLVKHWHRQLLRYD